jgi:hypothetical protein
MQVGLVLLAAYFVSSYLSQVEYILATITEKLVAASVFLVPSGAS